MDGPMDPMGHIVGSSSAFKPQLRSPRAQSSFPTIREWLGPRCVPQRKKRFAGGAWYRVARNGMLLGSHNKNDCSFWFARRASSRLNLDERAVFLRVFFLKLVCEKLLPRRASDLPNCSLVQNITNLNKTARSFAQNCSFARRASSRFQTHLTFSSSEF